MYDVIQVTETGEQFCIKSFRSEDKAYSWIDDNCENYPESSFFVEKAYEFQY